MWIEQYTGCGCSVEAKTKRDLLGYCETHGGNWIVRYFVRGGHTTTYHAADKQTTKAHKVDNGRDG